MEKTFTRIDTTEAANKLIDSLKEKYGEITHGVHFYMGASQFSYWEHTHLTLDAIPGNGGQFSLENGTGMRFIIRSRLYSDEEWAYLSQHPVKQCG
jgi:uncharacterized protein (DUF779 family)